MKPFLLIFCLFYFISVSKSQEWKDVHISLSAMRPASPFSKFAGLLGTPFHPLVEVGASYQWNKSEKNRWIQNVNIGFGYHRFLQSIVPVYTSFGYTQSFKKSFDAGLNLGLGYLHSYSLTSQFEWKNGAYERIGKFGRPQAIIRIGFYLQYKRLALAYENFLQTPFIKSYVPLMPYNLISISYHYPFKNIFKSYKKQQS